MVAEKGASGDFDYLREQSDGSDGVDVFDEENGDASESDLDYLLAEAEPQEHDGFDAFDENTWDEVFTPVPKTPWYQSRQALILLIASGTALSAIVISVVLLAFREPPTADRPAPALTTTPVTTPLATAQERGATCTAATTATAATGTAAAGAIHDGEGPGGRSADGAAEPDEAA